MKIIILTKKQLERLKDWAFACSQEMPQEKIDYKLRKKFFNWKKEI